MIQMPTPALTEVAAMISSGRLERMTRKLKRLIGATEVVVAFTATPTVRAAERHYQLVENWAQFPPGVTKWGAATGVAVDAHDNVYVLHRNEAMPIMVFD